jgi:glycosyltransferase involved in cell wall biosynthesis
MNSPLNVLFVSVAFPPKRDSEGLQVAKYFKYLVRDKSLTIDVVTSSDSTLFMPVDEALRPYDAGYRQIIKVAFFENKYVNFLKRKINPSSLNYPDSKFGFYKQWQNVFKRLEHKPDVIYSRSYPLSSTMMALHLQQKLQVPWVLHLSDPWTISPIHKLGDARQWNEDMEDACFKNASVISFTSQKTIDLYSEKYPHYAPKMMFFPNVFDLEDKIASDYKIKDKIKVVYTGGMVEDRSPEHLFKALLKLNNEQPEIVADYEFLFAGALDRKNRALFEQDIPSVKHLGLLPFNEALALQRTADLLLVVDTPFKDAASALFFPSKLLDYMLMQRRILALTDQDSTTWNIVDNKLGDCFVHDDVDGILQSLVQAWQAWKNQDSGYFLNQTIDLAYAADVNAGRLASLLHEVTDEK